MANSADRPPATRVRTTDSARNMLAAGEFGYPVGHLGHLTEQQQDSLVEFKTLCEEKGLFKPATDHNQSSHDDVTLLYAMSFLSYATQLTFRQPFSPSSEVRRARCSSTVQ